MDYRVQWRHDRQSEEFDEVVKFPALLAEVAESRAKLARVELEAGSMERLGNIGRWITGFNGDTTARAKSSTKS